MANWTLPIDTVQAIWHSAYPSLLHTLWTQNSSDPVSKGCLPENDACVLANKDELRAWFVWRFENETSPTTGKPTPVTGELNPFTRFPETFHIATTEALKSTYLVCASGVLLPRWTVAPSPSYEEPAAPGAIQEAIEKEFGTASSWYALGTQIDALRLAASQATLKAWRTWKTHTLQGFVDEVKSVYHSPAGWPAGLTLQGVAPTKKHDRRPSTSYFNPEDGAGYFTADGIYHMFGPPPPPVYDLADQSDKANLNNCGIDYASRYAYATPCSCASQHGAFFRPAGEP